jgi:hypothetical protein
MNWHDAARLFPEAAYLPRVGVHDGKQLEQLLAGRDLWQSPATDVSGAVIDGWYASIDPPVLTRLHEMAVPYLVDPQSLRFSAATYQEVKRLADLSYAPRTPITPEADNDVLQDFVDSSLSFQVTRGAAALLTPVPPLLDDRVDARLTLFLKMIQMAVRANSSSGGFRRPLLAVVAPGPKLLRRPDELISQLGDLPVSGFYVQPVRFNPRRDSVERLLQYVAFLRRLREFDVPVIAGRVGAFGLLLRPFGIGVFDSGLGEAEGFDLASLTRPRPEPTQEKANTVRGSRRLYLEPLKTTLHGPQARAVVALRGLRGHFACGLRCCRFRGFEDILDRHREHYLHTRTHEVEQLAQLPTDEMRAERLRDDLVTAQEKGRMVRRALAEEGVAAPDFAHLERWVGVLARATEVRIATSGES